MCVAEHLSVSNSCCRYLLVFQSASATLSLCVLVLLVYPAANSLGLYQSPAFVRDHYCAPAICLASLLELFQESGVDIFSVLDVGVHLFVMATCSSFPRGLREAFVVARTSWRWCSLFSKRCLTACFASCPKGTR